MYAPIELQRQYASTKGPCGGVATIFIPVTVAIVFALIYTTNQGIPDISQSSVVDLSRSAPLQLQISCTTADSSGNANPFCPGLPQGVFPGPAGFEFVPSISDTPCQRGIPRMSDRFTSQPWLDPDAVGPDVYTSPAFLSVEQSMGIPAEEIGDKADPFQLETFAQLAQDMSIVTSVSVPAKFAVTWVLLVLVLLLWGGRAAALTCSSFAVLCLCRSCGLGRGGPSPLCRARMQRPLRRMPLPQPSRASGTSPRSPWMLPRGCEEEGRKDL